MSWPRNGCRSSISPVTCCGNDSDSIPGNRHHLYSGTEGPLYEDEAQWELAYRLIRSFTASGTAQMHQDGWLLDQCYGIIGWEF